MKLSRRSGSEATRPNESERGELRPARFRTRGPDQPRESLVSSAALQERPPPPPRPAPAGPRGRCRPADRGPGASAGASCWRSSDGRFRSCRSRCGGTCRGPAGAASRCRVGFIISIRVLELDPGGAGAWGSRSGRSSQPGSALAVVPHGFRWAQRDSRKRFPDCRRVFIPTRAKRSVADGPFRDTWALSITSPNNPAAERIPGNATDREASHSFHLFVQIGDRFLLSSRSHNIVSLVRSRTSDRIFRVPIVQWGARRRVS